MKGRQLRYPAYFPDLVDGTLTHAASADDAMVLLDDAKREAVEALYNLVRCRYGSLQDRTITIVVREAEGNNLFKAEANGAPAGEPGGATDMDQQPAKQY